MGSTRFANRFTLTIFVLNSILSSIHLFPPMMDLYAFQRGLLSILRVAQGLLDFVAFVASTLSMTPNVTMWVLVSLLVPAFIYVLSNYWDTYFDHRLFMIMIIVLNMVVGYVAMYSDALLVGKAYSCDVNFKGEKLRVVEYKEIGFHPGAVFFLAEYHEEDSTWNQVWFKHIVDRNRLESISNPCEDVQSIFPDL
jgi:hypothetical protein